MFGQSKNVLSYLSDFLAITIASNQVSLSRMFEHSAQSQDQTIRDEYCKEQNRFVVNSSAN